MSKKKDKCGVYCIKNIMNGKIYIGSSKHIYQRWKDHKNNLIKGTHHNEYLQNAWDKYGGDNFQFMILLETSEEERFDYEQYYIDHFNVCDKNFGYNIVKDVYMQEMSEEMKTKISNTLKGKYVGENCFYSKYSEVEIYEVINLLMDINNTYEYISKKCNIPFSVISAISEKREWTELTKNITFPNRSQKYKTTHAKLNSDDIKEIIKYLLDGLSDGEISKLFNVHRKTISDIRQHKTWTEYTKNIIFENSKGLLTGELNNQSKLSIDNVKDIKNRLKNNETLSSISKIYNVSIQSIKNIKVEKTYKYV